MLALHEGEHESSLGVEGRRGDQGTASQRALHRALPWLEGRFRRRSVRMLGQGDGHGEEKDGQDGDAGPPTGPRTVA